MLSIAGSAGRERKHTPSEGMSPVAICEVCGNDYDKSMEITVAGAAHTFDSFECAIHAIAPRCEHCGCAIIGHGHEAGDVLLRPLRP